MGADAVLFAREGARVAIADIDRPQGRETVSEIQRNGEGAIFVELDVT